MSGPRVVRAPRGIDLTCKNWLSEAAYRMIQNNLDPEVAEKPEDLVVYGGRGKAARTWEAFHKIVETLDRLVAAGCERFRAAAGAEACSHPETEGMFWGEKNGQARRPVPPGKEEEPGK